MVRSESSCFSKSMLTANDAHMSVWRILDLLHIGPQVNYVHPQWIYIDPGWTYLGPSKIDYIWDK